MYRINCELRGTDNVQGQISGHIFAPNGGYCLYYPSNIFRNTRDFKNWRISSDIPHFWLGNIRSRDAFRPIARERKYLMDYDTEQLFRSAIAISVKTSVKNLHGSFATV